MRVGGPRPPISRPQGAHRPSPKRPLLEREHRAFCHKKQAQASCRDSCLANSAAARTRAHHCDRKKASVSRGSWAGEPRGHPHNCGSAMRWRFYPLRRNPFARGRPDSYVEFYREARDLRDVVDSDGEVPLGDHVAEVLDGELGLPATSTNSRVCANPPNTPSGQSVNAAPHRSTRAMTLTSTPAATLALRPPVRARGAGS